MFKDIIEISFDLTEVMIKIKTHKRITVLIAEKLTYNIILEQLCEKLAVLLSLTRSERYKPPFRQQVETSLAAKRLWSTSNT